MWAGSEWGRFVDNRSIAPHLNTVAKTYELVHVPEHRRIFLNGETRYVGQLVSYFA